MALRTPLGLLIPPNVINRSILISFPPKTFARRQQFQNVLVIINHSESMTLSLADGRPLNVSLVTKTGYAH